MAVVYPVMVVGSVMVVVVCPVTSSSSARHHLAYGEIDRLMFHMKINYEVEQRRHSHSCDWGQEISTIFCCLTTS